MRNKRSREVNEFKFSVRYKLVPERICCHWRLRHLWYLDDEIWSDVYMGRELGDEDARRFL